MPGDATPIQAISLEFFGDNKSALDAIDSLIAKLEKLQSVADKGLRLNISTQIDKAGNSAKRTKKNIDDLQQSIENLDLNKMSAKGGSFGITEGAERASKSVADLADTIKQVREVTADTADGASKSVDSLVAKIDTANTRIGATVTSLLGDIKNAGVIVESIGLPEYSQASADMSKIAGLLPEISHMGATTWGLPSESSAKYINLAADAVGTLAKHASGVMALAKDTDAFTSSLGSVAKETIKLQTKVDGLAVSAHNAYTEMNKIAGLLPAISHAGATRFALPGLSSAQKGIFQPIDPTAPYQSIFKGTQVPKTPPIPNTTWDREQAIREMQAVHGTLLEQNNPEQITEQTVQYHGLTAAVMGLAAAYDKLKKTKAVSLLTMEIPKSQMSLKSLGNIVKHTTTHFNKLLGSIKRIALYRAIRAAIRMITNGFKEGTENLYAWSNAFDSTREFANSMDRIATAALYVKNSLGAMVAPIINALAPALDYLANKFVGVLNIINEFIAAITGASTFTVARKIATSFKETEDAAGGAAKAVKSFTIGIDELNIIEDNAGGGSGVGGLNKDVEDWFEKQEVSNKMKQFVDDLKIYGDGISLWAEDTIKSLQEVADFWSTLGEEDYWEYLKSPEGITDTIAIVASLLSPFPLYALGVNAVANGFEKLFDLFEEDPLGAYTAFFTNMPLFIGFLGTIQDIIADPIGKLKELGETILKVMPLISPLFSGKQGSNFLNNITHPLDRLKTVWDNFKTGIGAIVDGVKKVSELIANGWEYNLKEVKKVLDKIWEVIKKILEGDIDDLWSSVISGGGNGENDHASSQGANVTDSFLRGAVRSMAASAGFWGAAFGTQLNKFFAPGKTVAMNQGIEIANSVKRGFTNGASSLYQKARDVGTNTLNAFKSNASYASFKSAGENIVNGIIAGLDSKKGSIYKSISVLAEKTGSKFNYTLKIQSPSKVFEESGKWIVAGLNKGITENEGSTEKTVDKWLGTFKNLSATVDVSNVSMPGMASILGEVSGNIRQSGSVAIKNETEDMRAFFDDVLMPVVNEIAADAKRQADKKETTEVYMDSRKVTESVNRQNRANGYSFTGV